MRVITTLRSGPAAWVALVLVPTVLWFGAKNSAGTIASWESATAQSVSVLGFVSAACGACAAWESARIHTARVAEWAPARSELQVACDRLLPVAVLGLLGLATALAAYAPYAVGTPGGPNAVVLATGYAVVLGHLALGYVVGRRLPRFLGAAAMLITGYFWGFWPAALAEPSWLRHLNGQGLVECCALDQVPAVRGLAATALFSAGVVAATLVLLTLSRGTLRVAVAWCCVGAATVGSVVLAEPLGFDGTRPRQAAHLRCTGDSPTVCLWPEQRAHRKTFVKGASGAAERLRAVGVRPPARVEFGTVAPSRTEVLTATATSLLPAEPPACSQGPGAEYPGAEAADALHVWLSLTAGAPADSLTGRWPDATLAVAREVRQLPVASQKAWFDRNLRSMLDCEVRPELAASAYAKGSTPA